jgi:hypothetical protein
MEQFRLQNLPPYAKLFVALFTTLMLFVVGWAMLIFYVDKGMVKEGSRPDYYEQWGRQSNTGAVSDSEEQAIDEDVDAIAQDSEAVLAPIWDSAVAGQALKVDTATMKSAFADRERQMQQEEDEPDTGGVDTTYAQLRRNVGLAHTHINGQTLLFFALGLIFLFTSVPPKRKKLMLWIFAVAVVTHNVGLTGETFSWVFDDLLAISGVILLVLITYIAFLIYADLAKKPER